MEAAEIARLREINDGFGRPDAQRSRLTVGEVLALLDALEQARKREGECAEAALDWEKEARIKSEQLAVVIFQRDAAQQALEQARKELAGAKEDIQGWHELWGEYNRTGSELSDMLVQRDASQQSAKDARALLVEAKLAVDYPSPLHARIEAFLEPKV